MGKIESKRLLMMTKSLISKHRKVYSMDDRYSRQMLFTPIGEKGQKLLRTKHVLIIGLGTLGTQSAEALTRAGLGKLTIVDRDYIEWSNLQRQYLYTEADANHRTPKAIAAKRMLGEINSDVEIDAQIVDVTPDELEELVSNDVDLILDATDNFATRMMINDMSQKKNVPWIYGSCVGSYGMSVTIIPSETPCLQCLLGKVPVGGPTCDTAGIIQPAASQVVVHQVTEGLKILTGNIAALRKKLISFDLWTNLQTQMNITPMKKADCPSCGTNPTYPNLASDAQMKTAVLCGRETVQIRPPAKHPFSLSQLTGRLEKIGASIRKNDYLIDFTIGDDRLVIFADGRALVHGTNDIERARTLYQRYVG